MKKAHFIGIGGSGISGLAQLFHHEGWDISGTNDEPSPQTLDRIEALGVPIHYSISTENIAPDTDLIVYSSAWDARAPEFMQEVRALGIPVQNYFEALGSASLGKRTVAIAGTHGKTTTTGMVAKILRDAGVSPTAVVGSAVEDFGSNYLPGNSDLFVVEACEYQRHFLELTPEVLIVTNIEFDHSDYYKDLADVQAAFRTFMEKVPAHGFIVTDTEAPTIQPLLQGLPATIINYAEAPAYTLRLPGEFNQMNARAAVSGARAIYPHLKEETVVESLATFHGTWRRFQYKGKTKNGADVYDDYAHHPTAARETLHALREKVAGKIVIAFHPHLFSRTRDLLDGFSRAFNEADEVLVAPIYPAREVDDGSISSTILTDRINAEGGSARAASFEEIRKTLEALPEGTTIMTMGAGDIFKIANAIVI